MQAKKILVIRFSSIGDIVLTTPVIRCLKQQCQGAEIHYVTKEIFREVLQHNPYLDKLHTFRKDIGELYEALSSEKFDLLIDLHQNLRSQRLKQRLRVKSRSFNKLNLQKFIAVNFKWKEIMPGKHIVDRYFETVRELGVKNDMKGLDYFIPVSDEVDLATLFDKQKPENFIALVVGGSYHTKKIPFNKLVEICEKAKRPVVILGGPGDKTIADQLNNLFPSVVNACGKLSVNQSASVISRCRWVITSDTGMMHVAAAFKKTIFSAWGNTIPEFGMGPYLPVEGNRLLEVNDISCRPCTKLGYEACPLGHFRCMNEIDYSFVSTL